MPPTYARIALKTLGRNNLLTNPDDEDAMELAFVLEQELQPGNDGAPTIWIVCLDELKHIEGLTTPEMLEAAYAAEASRVMLFTNAAGRSQLQGLDHLIRSNSLEQWCREQMANDYVGPRRPGVQRPQLTNHAQQAPKTLVFADGNAIPRNSPWRREVSRLLRSPGANHATVTLSLAGGTNDNPVVVEDDDGTTGTGAEGDPVLVE